MSPHRHYVPTSSLCMWSPWSHWPELLSLWLSSQQYFYFFFPFFSELCYLSFISFCFLIIPSLNSTSLLQILFWEIMFSETSLSFGGVVFCFCLESPYIFQVLMIPFMMRFSSVCSHSFPPLIIFVIGAVSMLRIGLMLGCECPGFCQHVHIISLGLHSDIPWLQCSVSLIFLDLTRPSRLTLDFGAVWFLLHFWEGIAGPVCSLHLCRHSSVWLESFLI